MHSINYIYLATEPHYLRPGVMFLPRSVGWLVGCLSAGLLETYEYPGNLWKREAKRQLIRFWR